VNEPATDERRHPFLVLDDQDTHEPIVPEADERRMTAR
jgi:hypothetical protein